MAGAPAGGTPKRNGGPSQPLAGRGRAGQPPRPQRTGTAQSQGKLRLCSRSRPGGVVGDDSRSRQVRRPVLASYLDARDSGKHWPQPRRTGVANRAVVISRPRRGRRAGRGSRPLPRSRRQVASKLDATGQTAAVAALTRRGDEDAESRTQLENGLAELPERQRTVVTLRDVHGLSSEEVSSLLGLSAGNQRVLLHRGRSRLRGLLEWHFATGEPVMRT